MTANILIVRLMRAGREEQEKHSAGAAVVEDSGSVEAQVAGLWREQSEEVNGIDPDNVDAFKRPAVPLARIKKIMKENEEVRMISGEAPIVLSKACELLISELSLYSWHKTDSARRRTMKIGDVFECIEDNVLFDFLQIYFLDTGKMHSEGYVVEEVSKLKQADVAKAGPGE